jgi:hypothetical protein
MQSVSSNVLQLFDKGEAPLLIALGIRPDLSIIVEREDKKHCACIGPLSRPLIALVLSYLIQSAEDIYAELRALTLLNGKDLEVSYLHLRGLVGTQFDNANTKLKRDYIESYYKQDDNWNKRTTNYLPQAFKPKSEGRVQEKDMRPRDHERTEKIHDNRETDQMDVVPGSFKCPITDDIMYDPVTMRCGHMFDKDAITRWLHVSNRCPVDNVYIWSTDLYPQNDMRGEIATYVGQRPHLAIKQQQRDNDFQLHVALTLDYVLVN